LFPEVDTGFTVAPVGEAMHFAFEILPERLYMLTKELPFGCHGFAKYGAVFWGLHINLSKYDMLCGIT
jgi:hypothetical protein